MTQDTYRFAYEEAHAELREILAHFDQLQARKEQVEQVVDALKALLVEGPLVQTAVEPATESAPYLVHQVSEAVQEVKQEIGQESFPMPVIHLEPTLIAEPAYAGEQASDPFQRRIDNALRHGLGSRESRILPRALSGLLSRA
jgi:hypothetical protein